LKPGPLALLLLSCGPLAAQTRDSLPRRADSTARDTTVTEARREVLAHAHVVRWYEAAAALGGVAGLMALDEPVQRFTQHHLRSKTTDDISSVFRQEGEAPYYAGISLGVLGFGLLTNKPGVRRAGTRLVAAVALSAAEMYAMKVLVGRSRPNEDVGAFSFHPFTSLKDSAGVETRGSMPSGHVTAAFAVATSLADDIKSPLVHVLLYTAASGTAFSRLNDNRHWLSDTGMGVVLGVFTAKVVNGHWRIFGLRPPGFLVTPARAAIGWSIPLGPRHGTSARFTGDGADGWLSAPSLLPGSP
jgi:membrane-associated phospholipid phosphatase